jgi:molybdate transport system substrate-binding protein
MTTTATGASGEVIVFAAASLTEPFNQIKAALEKANPGLKVTINFGGSNTLRAQLEQGAKADVFASANQTEMDNALKSSLVADKGSVFVRNRLVVILPKSNPGKVTKLQDLANSGLKFVTAQKDVPVGGYTLTALDKMSKDAAFGSDFSTKVQANIVSKETDVKQVVAKVQTGEADAGVVYTTDVSPKVSADITTIEIPDQFNTIATYPIAALKAAPNSAAAKLFVAYVLGPEGQAILKSYNFIPAATTTASSMNGGGSQTAAAAPPTTDFQLGGLVVSPSDFKLSDLQVITTTSVTTNPQAGNGSLGEHTYSGPLLYDLLQKTGLKIDTTRKNDLVRKVVLVTGSDGYSVAVAWGEIDPHFAGKKVIVAYQQDGQALPTKDGFARLVVPGDTAAGRYVSNIAKIEVLDPGDLPTLGNRKASTSLTLDGLVNNGGDFTLDKLKALKATDVTIETKDAQGNSTKTVYTGVLLNDLLNSAGLKLDANRKNDQLRKGIVAIGTDGYSAIIAGGEIDPKFAGLQILVAYSMNGQPLADSDGFARLVVPGDTAQGRYVSNLSKLSVVGFAR